MAEDGLSGWRRVVLRHALPRRLFLAFGAAAAALASLGRDAAARTTPRERKTSMSAHDFAFPAIEGGELPMKAWAGRPVLVVNTASFCGYTSQYRELEAFAARDLAAGRAILQPVPGRARGIAPSGALLVETAAGLSTQSSGSLIFATTEEGR